MAALFGRLTDNAFLADTARFPKEPADLNRFLAGALYCDQYPVGAAFIQQLLALYRADRARPAPGRDGSLVCDMIELDISDQLAALRSTFADIRAVVGVEKLEAEIADLSEQAGAPDLWDDTDKAQKVTSALSHRQAELAKIVSIGSRLDDIEIMVELANEEELHPPAGWNPAPDEPRREHARVVDNEQVRTAKPLADVGKHGIGEGSRRTIHDLSLIHI